MEDAGADRVLGRVESRPIRIFVNFISNSFVRRRVISQGSCVPGNWKIVKEKDSSEIYAGFVGGA